MIWYALCVPRQKEFGAERVLNDAGFDVRVPVIHHVRRFRRVLKKKVMSAHPAFPGWVFIGFIPWLDDDGNLVGEPPDWERLAGFKSLVKGLVADWKGEPLIFRPAIMHQIMRDFHQKPVRHTKEVRKRFRSGQLAEIISGPYMDRKVRIVPIPHHIPMLIEVAA